jgi:DNA-binding transcriptional MerR regulator
MSDLEARPHLSIGEVLALLQDEFPDVTISKIRFLESQGLLDPERTPSGYRKFYDDDIARLRWILAQQRDNFLPLRVIKERLAAATTAADLDATPPPPAPPVDEVQPVEQRSSPPDRAALAEALDRRAAQRAATAPSRLDTGLTDVSLSRAELAATAGITEGVVAELESFGLLDGRALGRDVVFDAEALVVARVAAAFLAHGLEVRHLRMFKTTVDREAGLYEQLVTPLVRQRNPDARHQAAARLDELAGLGGDLRDALLRQALRSITGS